MVIVSLFSVQLLDLEYFEKKLASSNRNNLLKAYYSSLMQAYDADDII